MSFLTAEDLRQAFAAATQGLEQHRDAINALNVFPVPDGDTGTNMLLTMRSAMEKCPSTGDGDISQVAEKLADGAFWGARGNSGVILSQFLKGFAEAFKSLEVSRGADLARALRQGADAAYRSVGQPVEGTMLTVIRSLSSAVQKRLDQDGEEGPRLLWEAAFRAAQEALDLTPTQLPVLREAGVVDAGGMGVVVFMGGALRYLNGRDDGGLDMAVARGYTGTPAAGPAALDSHYLDSIGDSQWGYCTQFVILGESLAPEAILRSFAGMSASAVVVGDTQRVRVHVHLLDPGPALTHGTSLGQLSQIEIQNMGQQNRDFVTAHRDSPTGESLAAVAVVPGDGLADLFLEAGCAAVVSGGQTMNPSVKELLDAVESVGAKDTIILPNNKNVVTTAEQAVETNPSLHLIPSSSIPQGVAALLAFNPEMSVEHNVTAMRAALSGVVTVEVTRAVRSSTLGGVKVAVGDYIGLMDGDLVVAGDTPEQALEAALSMAGLSKDQVVTLYLGAESQREDGEALRQRLESATPGMQVDLVYGGQPHYHYLASVE